MIVLDSKTDYSFLRGFGTPKQWLARCKDVGVTCFGVADYCSTWGHLPFRKAFKDSGVKLLYGVQVPVVSNLDRDPRHSLVTLIAKHDIKALYELMRRAHTQMHYRPRLLWEQLQDYEGWVIINEVNPIHARWAQRLDQKAFVGLGLGNYVDLPGFREVYAYGPRYPAASDRVAFDICQRIAGDTKIGEIDYKSIHLMRRGELLSLLPDNPDAFDNMERIAESDADVAKGTLISTFVPVKSKNHTETKIERLEVMALHGALDLGLYTPEDRKWIDPAYAARLDRELRVIEEKKFEDYFFFVADLLQWARARMLVGPGRGSSGGSLLCYCLGITTVDPLKFGTLFERFLDIARPDWPDIDADFPDTRREEIFTYLKDKYGVDRFAKLGTTGEFGGKSALNDVGRVSNIPREITYALGKFTEGSVQGQVFSPAQLFGLGKYEGKALLDVDHMKFVDQYPQIKLAADIDGHVRQHGVHPAGVVVTQVPAVTYGTINKEGVLEMDMHGAEDIGLLKMDVLGLKTLSVLQDACDLAKVDTKELFKLDWNDAKVYERIFTADRVTGIFQFEGHAVRSLMKGARCERFDDLCALTSLARPGPLIGGAAEHWAKCRIGEETPRELHKALESTYGVICYQEQAMAIVRDLAGFTEPEVNGFRRAVGKKDPEKLKAYRPKFVDGATNHFGEKMALAGSGADYAEAAKEKAEELWEELCEFGSYAFNLAHAVEYAMISYMAAWLKHYHPLAFGAACLKHADDDEQGKNLLRELVEEGYEYVPFDPEKSKATWSIIDGKLYGGFDSVRGIGEKTALSLCAKRDAHVGWGSWLDELTEAQRLRVTRDMNTPWHELTYFTKRYSVLYDDPTAWRSEGIAKGVKPPVLRIKDIPPAKGNYAFIGRIVKKMKKDANDPIKVAGRGGTKYDKDTSFWNLFVEDDTGQIGCTINRFKAEDFRWLTESVTDDRDFFFRGNVINANGNRWIFIDNVMELKNAEQLGGSSKNVDMGRERGRSDATPPPVDGGKLSIDSDEPDRSLVKARGTKWPS